MKVVRRSHLCSQLLSRVERSKTMPSGGEEDDTYAPGLRVMQILVLQL